jgi:hypothetical protein
MSMTRCFYDEFTIILSSRRLYVQPIRERECRTQLSLGHLTTLTIRITPHTMAGRDALLVPSPWGVSGRQ